MYGVLHYLGITAGWNNKEEMGDCLAVFIDISYQEYSWLVV